MLSKTVCLWKEKAAAGPESRDICLTPKKQKETFSSFCKETQKVTNKRLSGHQSDSKGTLGALEDSVFGDFASLRRTRKKSLFFSGAKKRGFLEGGFCKNVRLSWLWRSECPMHCWVQYLGVCFLSLGVTLDPAETPFAKTPLSWHMILSLLSQITL